MSTIPSPRQVVSHDFVNGVCRICGCSRGAVEHFGFACSVERALGHSFHGDTCHVCGCSREAVEHFGLGCSGSVVLVTAASRDGEGNGSRTGVAAIPLLPSAPGPPHSAAEKQAAVDGPVVQLSEQLMAYAGPEVYRFNAFRILGLQVTASPAVVRRQVERLQLQSRFGGGAQAGGPLPLDPPPTPEAMQQAGRALADPETRFLHELFWLWPVDPGREDPAIAALTRGDEAGAMSLWEHSGPAGRHNAAIYRHVRALDLKSLATDGSRYQDLSRYWREALRSWRVSLEDQGTRAYLERRALELKDPRLGPEAVQRIAAAVPRAVLRTLTGSLSRADVPVEAIALSVRHVVESGFDPREVDAALRDSVSAVGDRLEEMGRSAEQAGKDTPREVGALVRRLLEEARPRLDLLDVVLGPGHAMRNARFDSFAESVRGSLVGYGNTTKDWSGLLEILERIEPLTASDAARGKLRKDIDIVRNNAGPLGEALRHLDPAGRDRVGDRAATIDKLAQEALDAPVRESLMAARTLLRQASPVLAAIVAALGAEHPVAIAAHDRVADVALTNLVAWANETKKWEEAWTATREIETFVRGARVRERYSTNLGLVSSNASVCFFCDERLARGGKVEVAMHGDVERTWEGLRWRHATVEIPRCAECAGVHSTLVGGDAAAWFAGVGLGLVGGVAALATENLLPLVAIGGAGIALGITLDTRATRTKPRPACKPLSEQNSYPDIQERLKRGWKFGERPVVAQ